jgi:Bardet-Biedl syndrome 7 protein
MNILTLKGNFSQGEMHSWINNCLPEVPERVDSTEENVLIFKNLFVETFLICRYAKGEAEFKSDNISTISVIKDFLTKEATTRHIKIELQMSKNIFNGFLIFESFNVMRRFKFFASKIQIFALQNLTVFLFLNNFK